MEIMVCLLAFLASFIGALAGIGGGIIMKPVMDLFRLFPPAVINLLSGCTVLVMAVSALLRSRNCGIQLEWKRSTALAVGAAVGGLYGGRFFMEITMGIANQAVIRGIQTWGLFILNCGIMVYFIHRPRQNRHHTQNMVICIVAGLILGAISSFLGIGGGPYNIAALYLLFDLDAKTAARNSLYIIAFSQSANLLQFFITGSDILIPWSCLLFMIAGGGMGAMVGCKIAARVDNRTISNVLIGTVGAMIAINLITLVRLVFA